MKTLPFTDVERLALASFVYKYKPQFEMLLCLPDGTIKSYINVLLELKQREYGTKELIDDMRNFEITAALEMRDEMERKST